MKNYIRQSVMLMGALAGFASCSEKNVYDPSFETSKKQAEYQANFISQYGTPAASQNWGFAPIAALEVQNEPLLPGTRASNPNGNQWADYVEIPASVTAEESEAVYEYFLQHSKDEEGLQGLTLTDFFVLQAYKSSNEYTAANGQTVKASEHMDHLIVGDDHVYNFNNTYNTTYGGMMLMQNSRTDDFSYQNSTDGKQHHEYKLLEVPGYGYFVGFDFCADGQNPNQQVAADGIYTDGIVKIVPAVYKNSVRVMCEDLGSTKDFDFNDVVFDVAYTREYWPVNGTFAIITLQAAGGQLPLSVAGREVHEAFGVSAETMVNTGQVSRPAVNFRMLVSSTNPADLPVIVNAGKAEQYTLQTKPGSAPYQICVPAKVAWTNEQEAIDTRYPAFQQWVANPDAPFWR